MDSSELLRLWRRAARRNRLHAPLAERANRIGAITELLKANDGPRSNAEWLRHYENDCGVTVPYDDFNRWKKQKIGACSFDLAAGLINWASGRLQNARLFPNSSRTTPVAEFAEWIGRAMPNEDGSVEFLTVGPIDPIWVRDGGVDRAPWWAMTSRREATSSTTKIRIEFTPDEFEAARTLLSQRRVSSPWSDDIRRVRAVFGLWPCTLNELVKVRAGRKRQD